MMGAIIGDIVGSIYEWHNIKTKEFPFFQDKCFFTDDIAEQGSGPVASQLVQAVIDGKADRVLVQRADMLPAAVTNTTVRHWGGKSNVEKIVPPHPKDKNAEWQDPNLRHPAPKEMDITFSGGFPWVLARFAPIPLLFRHL